MQEQNSNGVYYRVYYRRIGVDPDRDFQQKTLKNLGNIGLYVVRINRKYYYTTYEVKVQVFNDMCEEPECQGPVSDPVEIYSAEDMPQVSVARWQNLIPSFPWIAPGWRARGAQSKERKGSNFAA